MPTTRLNRTTRSNHERRSLPAAIVSPILALSAEKVYVFELITRIPGLCFIGCAFSLRKPSKKIYPTMNPIDEPPQSQSFWRDEDGTTAVEYAVMLALIIAVCIGSVATLTNETKKSFDDSGAAIAGAMGN